jgi:hypothetical protein
VNRRRRRTPRRYLRPIRAISIITTLLVTRVAAQIATDVRWGRRRLCKDRTIKFLLNWVSSAAITSVSAQTPVGF